MLQLTPGHHADIRAAPEVIAKAGRFRRLIADRAYDADGLRADLRAGGASPVIPGRRNRVKPIRHDKKRYRERWRIEATSSPAPFSTRSPSPQCTLSGCD